jgi:protein-tyrosine phosphatase
MKRPDHPIPVDFLPRRVLKLPGRLGLTQAPGTWDGEPLPAFRPEYGRVAADLVALSQHHGVQALLTLQEQKELAEWGLEEICEGAARLGMESLWHPIPDGRAPGRPEEVEATVIRVVELLEAGKTVAIHCLAGLGRSGTIAAAVLVRLGGRPGTAIARVRAARPGAIQTTEQVQFIWDYARFTAMRSKGIDKCSRSV